MILNGLSTDHFCSELAVDFRPIADTQHDKEIIEMVDIVKWEYKVVPLDANPEFLFRKLNPDAVEDELNKFGLEGWELVRIDGISIASAAPPIFIFKRPV